MRTSGADDPPQIDILSALDAGEIGAWDWDLRAGDRGDGGGGGMRWSAQMFRNLGLDPAENGDLYHRLLAAIDASERAAVAAAFTAIAQFPGPFRVEARLADHIAADPRWVVFLGKTEAAEDGKPIRAHGITIDSTRRRKTEEAAAAAVAQSEARLREVNEELRRLADQRHRQLGASRAQIQAIFDNSPDWLTLFRAAPDGRFLYVDLNQATERAYGLRYDQIVGRSVEEVLGLEPAQLPLRLMRECIRTGENQRYRAHRTMAGVTRTIDVMFIRVPEQLNGDYHIMATARDITEHDAIEERQRQERQLFELIIENTSEGIIVVDGELRHLIWNAAMERINGRPRRDVLGRTVFEVFPEFVDHPVGHAWRQALAGRRSEMRDYRFFSEFRGVEVIYDADFTPLHDKDGSSIGAICILRETTERRRIEHLSRLETVAQLTGGVAHDFNNLLTAAMGCLDIIVRDKQSPRVASLAETALRSLDRGARLTQQLLAFSRSQALHPEAANLNQLLEEVETLVMRAAGETIEVVIDRAADLPNCVVDPAQFEAAVMNLIMNARDAMPNGGRLQLTTRWIAAGQLPADPALPAGDYVAFAVEDTGSGMTPEVAARALEPFYTTKEIGKGSGLGLSMVYGFAQQSGGGLRIDSEPGRGTCVTLYLPEGRVSAGMAHGAAAAGDAAEAQGSGTILVVEDDEGVREASVAMIQRLGYETLVACNGGEALDILRRPGRIDLLFTDLVMPGPLTGTALAREAQLLRPGLPVLLATGYAGLEEPAGDEFRVIAKPFRSAELSQVLSRLLQASRCGTPRGDAQQDVPEAKRWTASLMPD